MIICIAILIVAVLLLIPLMGASDLHYHRKPNGKRIRVACVGDSITNGALIPNCFRNSYPARLQRLLGEAYQVENFGLNDRTLQADANKPYSREKEYRRSLSFAPDILIILLGTNDTKPNNWISEERFTEEYKAFLKQYLSSESVPRIILCTPPWALPASSRITSLTNDAVPSVLPKVENAVRKLGAELSLPVAELYPLFEGKPELLSYDGLHPNKAGAQCIADKLAEEILRAAFS